MIHHTYRSTYISKTITMFSFLLHLQVKAMKTGSNWHRRDITVKDANGEIQLKLWNDAANLIQEENEHASDTFTNVEVDIFNNTPQLKTLDVTAIQVSVVNNDKFIIPFRNNDI